MNAQTVLRTTVAFSLLACSGSPDLPAGWEGARAVTSFTQAACGGSFGPDSPKETIDVKGDLGSVHVAYHGAHFRCAQSVEGFVRTGPKSVDFLVQPTDMNPTSVAECDCTYEITLAANAASGPTAVTVYRRWDSQSGSTVPLEIGTATAAVR